MKIAEVFLNQKNKKIDQVYEYLVPDEAEVGVRVNVNFGKGNRKLEGIIVAIKESTKYDGELKEVINIIDPEPVLDQKQIELCFYLADQSFSLFYETLAYFTSSKKTRKTTDGRYISSKIKKEETYSLLNPLPVRGSVQQKVIDLLKETDLSYSGIKEKIPQVTKKTLDRLIELGIIEVLSESESEVMDTEVDPKGILVDLNHNHDLTKKEFRILRNYREITDQIQTDDHEGQIVFILPEKFKAKNFSQILKNSFNIENGLYTGNLRPSEKQTFYHKVKEGKLNTIVGTSTALFLPYKDLKAVFVLDIGDDLYMHSTATNYNSVEVAEKLAEIWGADFYAYDRVPSMLAVQKIEEQDWEDKNLDEFKDLDIRIENINYLINKEENFLVSDLLYNKILQNIKKDQKTILFLNRKGYYNYYYCTECGETVVCPECGSNLKSVKNGKEVTCRNCGYHSEFPKECSFCGNRHFGKSQFGIEKISEQLNSIFPNAKVEMIYHNHIPNVKNADIIIGTKSLLYLPTYENVATAAALLIDLDFDYPDYRATENAYRLYFDFFEKYSDSEALIQTRSKDRSFLKAMSGKSSQFFQDIKQYRKVAKLPPYHDVYSITLFGVESKILNKESKEFFSKVEDELSGSTNIMPIYKVRGEDGKYMRRFIVKDDSDKFTKFIKDLYKNGDIEALESKVSIVKNPSSLS